MPNSVSTLGSSSSSTGPGVCVFKFDGIQWNLFKDYCNTGYHPVAPSGSGSSGETAQGTCAAGIETTSNLSFVNANNVKPKPKKAKAAKATTKKAKVTSKAKSASISQTKSKQVKTAAAPKKKSKKATAVKTKKAKVGPVKTSKTKRPVKKAKSASKSRKK